MNLVLYTYIKKKVLVIPESGFACNKVYLKTKTKLEWVLLYESSLYVDI